MDGVADRLRRRSPRGAGFYARLHDLEPPLTGGFFLLSPREILDDAEGMTADGVGDVRASGEEGKARR